VKKYENYENRCTVAEVIIKIKVTHVFEIRGFDSIQPTIVTDSTVGHPIADDGKNLASPLARQCYALAVWRHALDITTVALPYTEDVQPKRCVKNRR